jgi:preprotein translocase subunit YajC
VSFISTASAQSVATSAAPQAPGFDPLSFVPIALMIVVFYFLIIRPQQKKQKTVQDMLSAIKKGDRVLTSGGILGVVTNVASDQEVDVEIATGVTIKLVRSGIVDVLAKSAPVSKKAK